jgi:SpoVK/Ycf46/Vps4 family AAA+-type ATPase
MRSLLENGANLPIYNFGKISDGEKTIEVHSNSIFNFLLKNKINHLVDKMVEKDLLDFNPEYCFLKHPINSLMMSGRNDLAIKILDKNSDIELCDTFNFTLLVYSIHYRNVEMTLYLLKRGANVNHVSNPGSECLLTRILKWQEFPHKELNKLGIKDKDGNTPLELAIKKNIQVAIKNLSENNTKKEKEKSSSKKAEEELFSLVGLGRAKKQIRDLTSLMNIMRIRENKGFHNEDVCMHVIFSGSPGTGKTTVARLLGEIYNEKGFLERGHLVEVSRADLVGEYVGHTAQKVKAKFKEAKGGVLFIDEAYSLTPHYSKDFGREALDTIVLEMENNRKDTVVIVAGYERPMEEFLRSNEGLASRFKQKIIFEDYNSDELTQILKLMMEKQEYVMEAEAIPMVGKYFDNIVNSNAHAEQSVMTGNCAENFGNARGVRKFLEELRFENANRVSLIEEPTDEDVSTITKEDVVNVILNRFEQIETEKESYQKKDKVKHHFGFDLESSTKSQGYSVFKKNKSARNLTR